MNDYIDKVLVTGATGFVGSHLCKRLVAKGFQVCGVSHLGNTVRVQPLLGNPNFNLKVGDIRDVNFVGTLFDRDFSVVFHLAAQVPYDKEEKDYVGINTQGTLNLLNAAGYSNVRNFIYSSSISVYSQPVYLPVDEMHPTEPLDMYGLTKLSGESCCKAFEDVMNISILRYAGIYGVGSDRVVSSFTRSALQNCSLTVDGDGSHSSDFVYVEDIVQGILLAWRNGRGVYNIGSGCEASLKGLAEMIIRLTSSKSKIVFNSEVATRPFRFYADITKAKRELGYQPHSLENGLREYISAIS